MKNWEGHNLRFDGGLKIWELKKQLGRDRNKLTLNPKNKKLCNVHILTVKCFFTRTWVL